MANLNLNKVILAGRLTSDVELKATQSGTQYVNFSIAVNRPGKDGGVDFISVIAWRHRAEFLSRYFKKGSAILVCGELQTRTWTDTSNQKRYATEVMVTEVSFCESKAEALPAQTYAAPVYSQSKINFEAPHVETTQDDDLPC